MKVAICCPRFFIGSAEGTTKTLTNISQALSNYGIESAVKSVAVQGTESQRQFSSLFRSIQLVELLKKKLQGADIIHYYAPNPSLAGPLKIIKRSFNIPVICSVLNTYFELRDLRTLLRPGCLSPGLLREYLTHALMNTRVTAALSLTGLHTITVTNYFVKRKIESLGLGGSKIVQIPNAVDVEKFKPINEDKGRVKNYFGIPADDKVVLYYGHITHMRGLKSLVESMSILIRRRPNVRLVIAQSGLGTYNILDLISPMGIANRTTLLGVVDVNKLLTIADVGVIPFISPLASILFPNSLLEMMASEVPVVATDTGATSEVVYDGQTGMLVKPLNPSSLCYAIEKLLTNESLASRIGRNARDLMQRKFSFRSCTKQLIALYDQILS